MISKLSKLSILLMCVPLCGWAQISNVGGLTISEGATVSFLSEFVNLETGALINDGDLIIFSHFHNDGSVDFSSESNGLTAFKGSVPQYISGSQIMYFNNVNFNNSTDLPSTEAFGLSGEMSVENSVLFNSGIVNNKEFGGALIFQKNAEASGAFEGSFVDGLATKIGNNAFEFPIGNNGSYRALSINSPADENDIFSSQYFYENTNIHYPINNMSGILEVVNDKEYWLLNREVGTSEVMITLSWEEGLTDQDIYKEPLSDIRIVRWDETQQLWVNEGGAIDPVSKTITTSVAVDELGIFTLGRTNGVAELPDDVVIYNAVSANGDGKNDYFFIDNVQRLNNNEVQIFNRWGEKVFGTRDYDTSGNVFNGYAKEGMLVNKNKKLPTGTYFYVLTYDNNDGGAKKNRIYTFNS
jgi:gliding motility-associated-like protein